LGLTYVSEVTIVNQLHQEKHVEEDLALSDKSDFGCTHISAVKLFFDVLASLKGSGLARELQALVKVRKVELDDKDGVCKGVVFAQLFELFG